MEAVIRTSVRLVEERHRDRSLFWTLPGRCRRQHRPPEAERVRVRVPALLGDTPGVWALPCVSPGSRELLEVGERVWVAFEQGDIDLPVWLGTFGRFRGELREEI